MNAAFAAEQAADILRVQKEEADFQAWLMEQVDAEQAANKAADKA